MTVVARRAPAARTVRTPWLRAFGWTLSVFAYLSAWFWGVVVTGAVLILAVVSRWVTPEISAMEFAHHGGLWFLFSISCTLTVTYLPIMVANGMTRRAYTRGVLATAVVVGAAFAVLMSLAVLFEGEIYGRLGWFHGTSAGQGASLVETMTASYPVALAGLYVAGTLSGLLVGIAYYRSGGWGGTLTLPLTLLPIAVVSLLGLDAASAWTPWSATVGDIGMMRHVVVVVTLTVAAAALHLLTRSVPIHPKEA